MTPTEIPTLTNLEFIAYVDDRGQLPEQLQGKVGVYAVFDAEKICNTLDFPAMFCSV